MIDMILLRLMGRALLSPNTLLLIQCNSFFFLSLEVAICCEEGWLVPPPLGGLVSALRVKGDFAHQVLAHQYCFSHFIKTFMYSSLSFFFFSHYRLFM